MGSSQLKRKADFFVGKCNDDAGSLNFMKRVIAGTVSAILYYRGAFDEACYGEMFHQGHKLHILSNSSEVPEIRSIVELLKGVFEATGKNYLKQITIAFVADEKKPEEYLEAYFLKVTNSKNKTKLNCSRDKNSSRQSVGDVSSDEDEAASAAVNLMRNIKLFAQSMDAHERKVFINIKLTYNDDAPDDYVPNGYKMVEGEDDFSICESSVTLNCGEVDTKSHRIKVKMLVDENKLEPTKRKRLRILHS